MFVTDTHPLLWHSTGKNSYLPDKVSAAFQKAETGQTLIYIPAVVLLEVAVLEQLGKIKLNERYDRWAKNLLAKNGFDVVPLEPAVNARAVGFNFNNDLFDKIIVASALEVDAPLITKDIAITESNLVEIYW